MYKSSKLLTILLATLFMGFLSSCSDDDDGASQADLLIGTWQEIDCTDGNPGSIWTFKTDGSFIWDLSAFYGHSNFNEYGTWKLQNGVIVLFEDDEYYQIKQLDENRLIVQDIEEGHDGNISEFIRVRGNE